MANDTRARKIELGDKWAKLDDRKWWHYYQFSVYFRSVISQLYQIIELG